MLQGPGLFVTFLYYFSATTLITLMVVSQGLGASFATRFIYQLSVLFGLIAGVYGAYLNRSVTLTIPLTNQRQFRQTLDQALTTMGFAKTGQLEEFTVYGKSSLRTLFSGKILINIEAEAAMIIGRSSYLKRLNQCFKEVD